MPTFNVWIGDSQAVPNVYHLTPTNLSEGKTLTVTINGKSSTYTVTAEDVVATNGVVASACANFASQLTTLGQTVPEFGEITWSVGGNDDGETNYTYITATGPSDGAPLAITTSASGEVSGVAVNVLVVQNGSAGQNAIQEVSIGAPTGGTFTLSLDGQVTSAIAYNASANAVRDALCALSNIAGTDEVQTVTITGTPTGGDFTLTYSGQTTAAIAYNANAAAVQSALEALSNIAVGDVVCTGGALPGTAVTVTFRETLGCMNVAQMTADGAGLTGGTTPAVAIATATPGVDSEVTVTGSAGGPWTVEFVNGLGLLDVSDLELNGSSLTGSTVLRNRREFLIWKHNNWTHPWGVLKGNASVTAGTFTVTMDDGFGGAYTTDAIAYNATVRDVILAMRAVLPTGSYPVTTWLISDEDVFGSASMNSATAALGFAMAFSSSGVYYTGIASMGLSVDSTSLTGGTYTAYYTSSGGGAGYYSSGTETYRVRIGAAGTWSSYVSDTDSPATLQSALESLPEIGTGNVSVTAMNVTNRVREGFEIEFIGDLAGTELEDMQVDSTAATGDYYPFPQVAAVAGDVQLHVATTQSGSAARNEKQRITLAESAASGTFTLTWNPGGGNETTGTIAYNASAATVQTALEGLATPGPGDFVVTGSAGGPWTVEFDGTYQDTNVNTISGNGASLVPSAQVGFASSESTADSGPYHFDVAGNWSQGTVPANGEHVIYTNSDVPCKYNTSQAAINPAYLIIDSTYTGSIGLPVWNAAGYHEFRNTELVLGTNGSGPATMVVQVGEGDGEGAPLLRLNTGTKQTTLQVMKTGSSSETGLPALTWRGTHASNVVEVIRGQLGIGIHPGQAATVATLRMSFVDSVDSDADVTVGGSVTLGSVLKTGGVLNVACAITGTLENWEGDATVTGTGDVAAVKIYGGTVVSNTSGILGDYGDVEGATKASPCVVTSTAHGLATGDKIRIASVVGMVELNQNEYTIVKVDADSFQLAGTDSSSYTTYSSGGYWSRIGSVVLSGSGILDFDQSLAARQVGPAIDLYGSDAEVRDKAKRITTLSYDTNEFALHYHFGTPVDSLGTDWVQIRVGA